MSRVQVESVGVLSLQSQIELAELEIDQIRRDLGLDREIVEVDPVEDDEPIKWVMPEEFSSADALDVLREIGGMGSFGIADIEDDL